MRRLRQALIETLQRRLRRHYRKEIADVLDPFRDMQRLLRARPVRGIVDGGAYHGEVAVRLARLFPGADVYAFEPASRASRVLEETARAVPAIRSIRAGLSSSARKATLYVNAQESTNALSPVAPAGEIYQSWQTANVGTEEVELTTLDGWVAANGGRPVDLLKLDLQGHELEALHGAERTLRTDVRLVYTEVEFVRIYRDNCLYHELESYLRPLGFEVYQLYGLTRGGDGQLVCGDAIFLSRDRR
jgi:FkbM family methyltransferase